jgi:hypothetical protein
MGTQLDIASKAKRYRWDAEELRRVAFHEAGHAVAYAVVWGPSHVTHVEIEEVTAEYGCFVQGHAGYERVWIPQGSTPYERWQRLLSAMCTCSGPWFDHQADGDQWSFHDWWIADEDAFACDEEGEPDMTLDGNRVLFLSGDTPAERKRFLSYLDRLTNQFCSHPTIQAGVDALAAELIKMGPGRMEGETVGDILESSMGIIYLDNLGPTWKRRLRDVARAIHRACDANAETVLM